MTLLKPLTKEPLSKQFEQLNPFVLRKAIEPAKPQSLSIQIYLFHIKT